MRKVNIFEIMMHFKIKFLVRITYFKDISFINETIIIRKTYLSFDHEVLLNLSWINVYNLPAKQKGKN